MLSQEEVLSWHNVYTEWESQKRVLCLCTKCHTGSAFCERINTIHRCAVYRHFPKGFNGDICIRPQDLLKQLHEKYGAVVGAGHGPSPDDMEEVPNPSSFRSGSSPVNDDEAGDVEPDWNGEPLSPSAALDDVPGSVPAPAAAPLPPAPWMEFPPRRTVYSKHGTISFYAERGQALKAAASPPSEPTLRGRIPSGNADGCVAVMPLEKCLDAEDPELREVAELVCTMLAHKARWNMPQEQYSSLMGTLCSLPGVLQPEAKALLEENAQSYYKAKKFLEKLGYGVRLYVYHVCSNVKCSHIFRNESKDLDTCPCHGCGQSRYKNVGKEKEPLRKTFYLSLHDWIVGLHSAADLQELLRWHKDARKQVDGIESDVYDTPLWKLFTDDAQMQSSGNNLGCFCYVAF